MGNPQAQVLTFLPHETHLPKMIGGRKPFLHKDLGIAEVAIASIQEHLSLPLWDLAECVTPVHMAGSSTPACCVASPCPFLFFLFLFLYPFRVSVCLSVCLSI